MQLTRTLRLGTALFAACLGVATPVMAQSSMEHQQSMTSMSSITNPKLRSRRLQKQTRPKMLPNVCNQHFLLAQS